MATGSHSPVSRLNQASLGIPGEKERYQIYRDLTIKKIDSMLLPLMRKHEIDMWITMDREYHPDPFQRDIGGRGGVRNAYAFYDNGETLEKFFIFSHGSRDDLVTKLYDELTHYGYRPEDLRPLLAEAVTKRNPRRIAVNMSPTLPMAEDNTVGFGDRVRYPIQAPMWNSIELHVGTPVPEWDGNLVRVGIEEPSILHEHGLEFFVPRQRKWLLIPSD